MATKSASKKNSKRSKKAAGGKDAATDEQEPLSKFRRGAAERVAEETDGDVELTNEDTVAGGKTQLRVPGAERPRSKKVEKLALELNNIQSKRLRLQDEEREKREELTLAMERAGIPRQDLPDGLEAVLDSKVKALVHAKKDE